MSLRGAISFLGDEWAKLNRMIEALEREAETHHKRHLGSESRKDPSNPREISPPASLFTPADSSHANRRLF
jgi:hypothetical protein